MTDVEPAISIVNLGKRYSRRLGWRGLFAPAPEKVALEQVNLTIPRGEIFGLLGPNGAGKTTLVKILATLVLPTEGSARISGLDVVQRSLEVRRRVGVVYGDERTFFWRLSVLENLRFYAALYQIPWRDAEKQIRFLLDLVGLSRDLDVPMHAFSTGMKQRAAIARGLLSDPEILFMDEPTRGLDPLAALELRRLVQEHVADGRRTVLIATHIMAEAEDLCNRLAFLNHGRVQFVGSIDEIRTVLQVDQVHTLVVSDVDATTIAALERVPDVKSVACHLGEAGMQQLEVTVLRGTPAVPLVIREIVNAGGAVWSSAPRELSLEDVFAIAMNEDPSTGDLEPQGGVARYAAWPNDMLEDPR